MNDIVLPEMLVKYTTKRDLKILREKYGDKELKNIFNNINDPIKFVNKLNELLGNNVKVER